MLLHELTDILGYSQSTNYRGPDSMYEPSVAHMFRTAFQAGAKGAYVFQSSGESRSLPPRPAVFLAEADSPQEARAIHRNLWNLGSSPFLIVLLPDHIRVYTCFDYDQASENKGILESDIGLAVSDIIARLSDFRSDSVDSGYLWQSRGAVLDSETRVDRKLLRNLQVLGKVLRERGLDAVISHSLIGKYVYIRYLYDRGILSLPWLAENDIDLESVLGREATLSGLRKLVNALESRFNGSVFPMPLEGDLAPADSDVRLVASVFKGDVANTGQMHLDFAAYDFRYIPIELLSSIYEQFLHAQDEGESAGAYYTPEPLADYLLSEVNLHRPLRRGMRILDPSCGSGVFLVLAYRRLIEMELSERRGGKLRPVELRKLLLDSIYGVERAADACYVTEFSLLLTMLSYIDPPDLHRNKRFKFPVLHNLHVFECDFFDDTSKFWKQELRFDWIVGNPPWIEIKPTSTGEQYAMDWIAENRAQRPVAGGRVSEAFSWRLTDLWKRDGIAGLILHAKSLVNQESTTYRRKFFRQHEVLRITDFANMAYVLFGGRAEAPAATVVYRRAPTNREKNWIVHYGPFVANQVVYGASLGNGGSIPWTITINESEIQTVRPTDAETGESTVWKLALWGTHRDWRAIERLQHLFPDTLLSVVKKRQWILSEGLQLRSILGVGSAEPLDHVPELDGKLFLLTEELNKAKRRFSIPETAFQPISPDMCYVRKGRLLPIRVSAPPHLVLHASWNYAVFSDREFVVPPRQIGLTAPAEDADYLRAISVYLSSSVVRYFLFFTTPEWGVDRNRITLSAVKKIPVPDFSPSQVTILAGLQKELAHAETANPNRSDVLLDRLDDVLSEVVAFPRNLPALAREFMDVRLMLNKGKVSNVSTRSLDTPLLRTYAAHLGHELDAYAENSGFHHKVDIVTSPALTVCTIELTRTRPNVPVSVQKVPIESSPLLREISDKLKEQFSQWVYVRRGLRLFDGPRIHICRTSRLIDWTTAQALNDADEVIGEVLSIASGGSNEV